MSLHETLDKIRSAPTPNNEETAKLKIIAPVLSSLGWDPFGHEVLYEHAVGGKGGGRVDIALDGPDHIVALIEAKAPGQDLGKHVDQVIAYAFHQGVDICVLTTGLEWWLYLPMEKGPPDKRLFLTLQIHEDRVDQLAGDLTTFLRRENLRDGQARRRAKQVLAARHLADRMNMELPKLWTSMLSGPDDDLVELVRKRAYETLSLRPDRKQVAAVLRGSPVPTVVVPEHGNPKEKPVPPKTDPGQVSGRKPTGIRLWGKHYEVKVWKDVLLGVGIGLYDRYGPGFDRVLKARGHKHPWASRNRDEIPRSAALVGNSGIYLDTHFGAADIRRRAGALLKLFDHDPVELEYLYD